VDIKVDPAELRQLSADMTTSGENAESMLSLFTSAADAGTPSVFGSQQAAASYNSLYDKCRDAVNQTSSSLTAVAQRLSVAASSYEQLESAATPRSDP
jgi:uncharacterized protein YukE